MKNIIRILILVCLAASLSKAQCVNTGATWWTQSLPTAITTSGVVKFDEVFPNATTAFDAVVGVSQGASTSYPNLSAITRVGSPSAGMIQSYSTSQYVPTTPLSSTATTIHFEWDVRIATQDYDAYFTPDGGTKTLIGTALGFRSTALGVISLDTIGGSTTSGTVQVCNITVALMSTHKVTLNWVQGVIPPPPSGTTWVCPTGSIGTVAVMSNAVYRATTTGQEGLTPYAVLTTPSISYVDMAVQSGTTYFYQVTATNCAGESLKSNETSATIPSTTQSVPNVPTGLGVTAQ